MQSFNKAEVVVYMEGLLTGVHVVMQRNGMSSGNMI